MKNQTKENTPAKTAKHGNKRVTLSGACSAAVENVQNKWALAAKHKAEADQVAGKADSTLATLTAQIGYGITKQAEVHGVTVRQYLNTKSRAKASYGPESEAVETTFETAMGPTAWQNTKAAIGSNKVKELAETCDTCETFIAALQAITDSEEEKGVPMLGANAFKAWAKASDKAPSSDLDKACKAIAKACKGATTEEELATVAAVLTKAVEKGSGK